MLQKNWALAMMLKALPLVHFWSVLLLKEQMMTSVRKTLKTLVWSTQNRSISSDVFPENNHKIRRFFTDCFPTKLVLKIPAKFREIGRFSAILSLKIPRNLTFFFPQSIRSPVFGRLCWSKHSFSSQIHLNRLRHPSTNPPPFPILYTL